MKYGFLLTLPLAMMVAGCQTSKSSNPLSPSVAGPIPGVDISAPKILEPAPGWDLDGTKQPLTLLLENALSTGVRPLSYTFEVASDAAFTNKVFARDAVSQGEGGRTSLRLPDPLAAGRTYYWRARAEDGANTGPYSSAVNFNLFIPIVINEPAPFQPVSDVTVTDVHPRFIFANAPTSGPIGTVGYTVEIATDATFTNKTAVWNVSQQPSETKLDAPANLSYSRQYFWRVRGYDQTTVGPWSATHSFRTPEPPAAPVPSPLPGAGTSPGTPCGPPYANNPFVIVQCRRSQYGHMSSSEVVGFLRGVAKDLNAAGIPGGPFGILRKTSGNNCNGYSCDIVCNSREEGWDVLGDSDGAQFPGWGGPKPVPNACEIQ